jgi:simple sugar transport system ATP-binding protein
VLRYIAQAKARNLGVIFITHNVHHAYPVADAFTILKRGTSYGTFRKDEVSREEVLSMMAGGEEMEQLSSELEEFARDDGDKAEGKRSSLGAAAAAEEALADSLKSEADKTAHH